MKQRVSITVDRETLEKVKERIRRGQFRNQSHAFEYAINQVVDNG